MRLSGIKIGLALTGSHCTLSRVLPEICRLRQEEGAEIMPILSESVDCTDTRFGTAASWKAALLAAGCQPPVRSITEAEPIGPRGLCDAVVIAPCSGNTLAKLAGGIVDSPVLMAAKAQLRNGRPLVLAISTNDGLGMNARNIGLLLNSKQVFFVPFGQDDPFGKPNSLVADMRRIGDTLAAAISGQQIQPILLQY